MMVNQQTIGVCTNHPSAMCHIFLIQIQSDGEKLKVGLVGCQFKSLFMSWQ